MRNEKGQFIKGIVSHNKGIPMSENTKLKLSFVLKGRISPNKGKRYTLSREICEKRKGKGCKSNAWKKDRSTLKKIQMRNDSAYYEWRKQVWLRDSFKCKIANPDCKGKIEAHHILAWRDFVELRYNINNGITLCHFHHPRKRKEEKRLSPYFMELVSVSKV